MADYDRKLPIGMQDFEDIRREGYLYVDKTEYIYKLVNSGKPFFLSRPRRFGKSLFLSTLRAYFEGKKELFSGLKIEKPENEKNDPWQEYPVFYFDFNKKNFREKTAFEEVLESHLTDWEQIYGDEFGDKPIEERFQRLIEKAHKQTGKNVVVLVDEYDKALLETSDAAHTEHNRAVFKGFFSTLKSYDRYLKFVFITGVTKFSKVSIFSDLNHLKDISLLPDYSAICGITEDEIRKNFTPEIHDFAGAEGTDDKTCLEKLKEMYDGYHFSRDCDGVYNPFSLLNALSDKTFNAYWFSTGTPTFLIEKLKESDFDPKVITEGELYADEASITDYRYDNADPVPLFYQTGYLTIKGYDKKYRSYLLGYPNDEVKYGFLESLSPMLLQDEKKANPLDIRSFGRDIDAGNTESFMNRFRALFARLPYPDDERIVERNFQNVIYIVFMLLGQYAVTELHSSKGRADCIVETDDFVYIFEFKRDKSADCALRQIEDLGYAISYEADPRTLIKVGVNFSTKDGTIDDWKMKATN